MLGDVSSTPERNARRRNCSGKAGWANAELKRGKRWAHVLSVCLSLLSSFEVNFFEQEATFQTGATFETRAHMLAR